MSYGQTRVRGNVKRRFSLVENINVKALLIEPVKLRRRHFTVGCRRFRIFHRHAHCRFRNLNFLKRHRIQIVQFRPVPVRVVNTLRTPPARG